MSKKLKYLVWHCTATPEGRVVTSGDIIKWHMAPRKEPDGSYVYKGKKYMSLSMLPNEFIEGVSIKKLQGRGWDRVGYSKLVMLDGSIHSFVEENDDDIVDPWEVTYGVAGINSISRHYCYVGGLDKDTFQPKDTRTKEQLITMRHLTKVFLLKYLHSDVEVKGHYHFAKKACPCFDVDDWLKKEKEINHLIKLIGETKYRGFDNAG